MRLLFETGLQASDRRRPLRSGGANECPLTERRKLRSDQQQHEMRAKDAEAEWTQSGLTERIEKAGNRLVGESGIRQHARAIAHLLPVQDAAWREAIGQLVRRFSPAGVG